MPPWQETSSSGPGPSKRPKLQTKTIPAFKPLTITKPCSSTRYSKEDHGNYVGKELNSSDDADAPDTPTKKSCLDKFRFNGAMTRGIRMKQVASSERVNSGNGQNQEHLISNDVSFVDEIRADSEYGPVSQVEFLVEEEGLYEEGGDYTILTPTQQNSEEGKESQEFSELGDIPADIDELLAQPPAVAERFCPPSDLTIVYGDESPEIFDPNLRCPTPIMGDEENVPEHRRQVPQLANDEDEEMFEDDDLWRNIALHVFDTTPRAAVSHKEQNFLEESEIDPGQPFSQAEREELMAVGELLHQQPNTASETLDKQKQRQSTPVEEVELTGAEPKPTISTLGARGRRDRKSLPKTLTHPICHTSTTDTNSQKSKSSDSPNAKRIFIFEGGSEKLALIARYLESLDEPEISAEPPEPSIPTTTWAHLPPTERQKPFVRPRPPAPVQERPVIEGLSAKTVIRTCFRIGEALAVAGAPKLVHAGRETDVLVELFARVTFSERRGMKQNIQFADIFHDNPPYLSAIYTHFRSSERANSDSENLLGEQGKGKMVRAVGRVKRWMKTDAASEGRTVQYQMDVVSVWECGWEEVERARGAVCGW